MEKLLRKWPQIDLQMKINKKVQAKVMFLDLFVRILFNCESCSFQALPEAFEVSVENNLVFSGKAKANEKLDALEITRLILNRLDIPFEESQLTLATTIGACCGGQQNQVVP